MRCLKAISLLLCSALFLTRFATAQETTSEIQGIIKDEKDAPLAGATIVAIHLPTATKYTTTSRKDGRYNLPNLRIGGPYEITVSFVGYANDKQDNITLTLGQEYKADFTLKPGSTSLTEVVVTASRADKVFNNSRTGAQEIINRTQIERLPTINRSLQDFTKLTPSANGLSFGGRSGSYNNVTVDGANFNNAFGLSGTLGGQTNSQPISLDALEQIQVSISPYDVRQGGFSGAGINSVTRSGTNKIKGTLYTYLRNPETQGYKVGTNKVTKLDFNYNLYGFVVGGPIIKNKLFFFVNAEQERRSEPATTFIASRPGQTPVPGAVSQAVADTLDALKQFLITKFGFDPGSYQGYNYRTNSDRLTIKFDWNINANNTFTVKYNYLRSLRDVVPSNSGSAANGRLPSNTGMPFSSASYTINNNFDIVIGELITRMGNKASNKLQIGYTALRDFRSSFSPKDFPLVDILNGQGATYTVFGYEPFTYNNKLNSDIFQLNDIYTFYKGSHEITVGTQNAYKRFLNGFAPNYAGTYRFASLTDFYNSVNNNLPRATQYDYRFSSTKDGSFPFAKVGALELGFFAQDKWRMNNHFTLTYGLRADIPIFESKFETNENLKNLTFRDGLKVDVGAKPKAQILWSPRVGFNWDVKGDRVTQLRGGVGLFAGPPPFVWISNQASNNGVQFGSYRIQPGVAGVSTTDPRFIFNADINANRAGTAGNLATSYNIAVTDKNFKYPQVLRANIAVDRKFPGNLVVTVEGSYSLDVNGVYFQNINLPSTGTALQGQDNRIRYTSPQIYAGNSLTNPNISDVILMRNATKGYSYFVTVQVQKTFKNLYLNAAYTHSRARSMNDGGSIAQSMWRDRQVKGDPNTSELGYSNFYQPHRVIVSASYRIEYAKYFATSVGLVYEAAPSGATSYVYNGDVNNDAAGGNNDLMYIPRDKSEIVLEKSSATDPRTPDQIWAQLNNYINQDWYLSKNRGKYAERNAVVLPFFKKMDLNFTQDFYVKTGKNKADKHTMRLTFDIINFGNLISSRWGIVKSINTNAPIRFLRVGADGKPVYTFPYFDNTNQIPLVNTFQDNTGLTSRWQMQVGIRYLFNN
jgi:hypothetical protein